MAGVPILRERVLSPGHDDTLQRARPPAPADSLARLLAPRSIAVIGASSKPSTGRSILASLSSLGFQGKVYPVNPSYTEVLGHRCYPSVEAIPDQVDLAAFCISNTRLLEAYRCLAKKGLGAAVVYSSGFGEVSEAGSQDLNRQLVAISQGAGIALCGPNCMGVLSPASRSSAYMNEVHDPLRLAGNVGLISQSGSMGSSILVDCRRFGFSHIISSGNEAVLSTSDYLEYLINDPDTKVIALFSESIREPSRFLELLDRAVDADKPVVILKVGKSERTRQAILTHTGGLAGEARVFSEMLRSHRAIEVNDLDELCEVLAACQSRHRPRGPRIGVVTGSGGQVELLLDRAAACQLDLPVLSEEALGTVSRTPGPVTGLGNPLDAWGNGDFRQHYQQALDLFGASSQYDAVVLCIEGTDHQPLNNPGRSAQFAQILADAAQRHEKPFYSLSMRSGMFRSDQLQILKSAGVGVIGGAQQGLLAIKRLGQWARPLPPRRPDRAPLPDAPLVRSRRTIHEYDAKRWLAAAGIPILSHHLARSLEEAREAARQIGYPVVLKAISDEIAHRTEWGLIHLEIADPEALEDAWIALIERHQQLPAPQPALAGILVERWIGQGVEVLVGVARDPEFGLVLSVGFGGVLVELHPAPSLRALPLREGDALAMLHEQPALLKLLQGVRGSPACDVAALIRAIEAVGDFAWQARRLISEIDLNPMLVGPGYCVALDALMVPVSADQADSASKTSSGAIGLSPSIT